MRERCEALRTYIGVSYSVYACDRTKDTEKDEARALVHFQHVIPETLAHNLTEPREKVVRTPKHHPHTHTNNTNNS